MAVSRTVKDVFKNAEYGSDHSYHTVYDKIMQDINMGEDNEIRRMRFWNLMQWYMWNKHIQLPTVECGVYKGLASSLMQMYHPQEHHVFDSFEGLSAPTDRDNGTAQRSGKFACDLQTVQHNLRDYDQIHFYKGWIPTVFQQADPDREYRFVHIDVDFYDPIYTSLKYFWPKVCNGGVIVVDDYGYRDYPGARKAVVNFCVQNNLSWVPLSTGNAIILKQDRRS